MAVQKSKVMRDGTKLTKYFCRIGVVVLLLLLVVTTASGLEKLDETFTGTNQTENQVINEVESGGLIFDAFFSVAMVIRARYMEITFALVIILLLIFYVCKCVLPQAKRKDIYKPQIDGCEIV